MCEKHHPPPGWVRPAQDSAVARACFTRAVDAWNLSPNPNPNPNSNPNPTETGTPLGYVQLAIYPMNDKDGLHSTRPGLTL